jgi:hypothetical protein
MKRSLRAGALAFSLLATSITVGYFLAGPPEGKSAALSPGAVTTPQHIVVPAYQIDVSDWGQINQLGTGAMVIDDIGMGDADGTTTPTPDTTAQAEITAAQGHGLTVLGYVPTNGGSEQPEKKGHPRTKAVLEWYVDQWYHIYHPDGIFFDEGPTDSSKNQLYLDLRAHVTQQPSAPGTLVWLNGAGARFPEVMQLADIVNIWEGFCSDYNVPRSYNNMLSWMPNFSPQQFSEVVTDCPSQADMLTAVAQSKDRGAGYIYILDTPHDTHGGTPGTGYNHVPPTPYWNAEVTAVASGPSTTQRPPISMLVDTFSGSTISPSLWTTPTESNQAQASQAGKLILAPHGGLAGSAAGIRSTGTFNLINSQAFVSADQMVNAVDRVDTSFNLVYETYDGASDTARLTWLYANRNLYAGYTIRQNGTFATIPLAVIPYDPANPTQYAQYRWWRIYESGGTVYWDTADSQQHWSGTPVASIADTQLLPLNALKVELDATTYPTGTPPPDPGEAHYTNLNVLEVTPSVTPTPPTPTATTTSTSPTLTIISNMTSTYTPLTVTSTDTPAPPTVTTTSGIPVVTFTPLAPTVTTAPASASMSATPTLPTITRTPAIPTATRIPTQSDGNLPRSGYPRSSDIVSDPLAFAVIIGLGLFSLSLGVLLRRRAVSRR